MIIKKTMSDGWLSNTYLVADKPGGHAVLIDTGGPMGPILEAIENEAFETVISGIPVLEYDAVIAGDLSDQVERVLSSLAPREEKVLRLRFGLGEPTEHTLEEVGQTFQLTRERIRQIEAKALKKLRHPSRAKRLQSFVDWLDN